MSKLDKMLIAGVGIYLFNDDSKLTDRDVAGSLLIAAASVIGIKLIRTGN